MPARTQMLSVSSGSSQPVMRYWRCSLWRTSAIRGVPPFTALTPGHGLGAIGQSIAHPMHAAALPTGAEDPADRRFQPLMGIGDDQLDAAQTPPGQALQKARPERFGLRRTDVQPDDLTPAVTIGCHGNYGSDRDNAAALALPQIGGVEP